MYQVSICNQETKETTVFDCEAILLASIKKVPGDQANKEAIESRAEFRGGGTPMSIAQLFVSVDEVERDMLFKHPMIMPYLDKMRKEAAKKAYEELDKQLEELTNEQKAERAAVMLQMLLNNASEGDAAGIADLIGAMHSSDRPQQPQVAIDVNAMPDAARDKVLSSLFGDK